MKNTPLWIKEKILRAKSLILFLDYDGTLAEFAPNPDVVIPDDRIIGLVSRLLKDPRMVVAIVSGRRLQHIEKLVPVGGVWLAGTYGVELRRPDGKLIKRLVFDDLRPALSKIKPEWQALIEGKTGFYLEDKGWSLALHAKDAPELEAENVIEKAYKIGQSAIQDAKFQLLGGNKFIEISPQLIDKGDTVEFILQNYLERNILPIYIGDDDKDEVAFRIVKRFGGVTIYVTDITNTKLSDMTLGDSKEVHQWLDELLKI